MNHNFSSDQERSSFASPIIFVLMIFWGVLIAALARNDLLQAIGNQPPIMILLAAVFPSLIFLFSYRLSAPLRRWVANLDLEDVFALQAWRVVGAAFLFTWGYGLLPAGFALPAGIGDIVVGLAAPFVAIKIAQKSTGWRSSARWLIIAGLLDFAIAFATGIMFRDGGALHSAGTEHTGALAEFPLTLIPSYLVPAFLILHIIAIIKLRNEK